MWISEIIYLIFFLFSASKYDNFRSCVINRNMMETKKTDSVAYRVCIGMALARVIWVYVKALGRGTITGQNAIFPFFSLSNTDVWQKLFLTDCKPFPNKLDRFIATCPSAQTGKIFWKKTFFFYWKTQLESLLKLKSTIEVICLILG